MHPILLNSCARAATAAEARYRIDRPIAGRSARVVALDDGAAGVVLRVAGQPWWGARFFTCEEPGAAARQNGGGEPPAGLVLRAPDGSSSRLVDQLAEADVVIMIATTGDGAEAASAIAQACARLGIMTAGLILGATPEVGPALAALRPYARVLMATDDEHDVSEVLTALRA